MPMYHVHIARDGKTLEPNAVELPDAERHAERPAEGLTTMSSGFGVGGLRDCHVKLTDTKGRTLARYALGKTQKRGTSPGRSEVQRRLRA
jgi:hypothetical protein